jgi:tRNA (uracil-5-)-methyltransferase
MLPWESDPARYEQLLREKANRVEASFGTFDCPPAQRFPSPPEGYRARAEFRVWHDGDDLDYVMFDPRDPRTPVRIERFPAALESIQALMPRLLMQVRDSPLLRKRLFQVEFMGSTTGDLLITLAYHRKLDSDWVECAAALAQDLSLAIVGRSRKQKEIIGRDFISEQFTVQGRAYQYRQYEQAFAQPNAPVNTHMLNWVCDRAADLNGDLLELYCGNGNFTLPLAAHFNAVLATELSKSGTRAAQENLTANGIDNVAVARLSAAEVSQAIRGEREFRRLATLPQPLENYDLKTVFVDPPRAGLDPATLACVQQFDTILYISCNPNTLRENLEALHATHKVKDFALFDQFPYTDHMECGMKLVRR